VSPGGLPTANGKQVIRALEHAGWYVKRVRGSHHILRHPTVPDAIPVPVHGSRPVATGTLRNIVRTAGLSLDEFAELLKR